VCDGAAVNAPHPIDGRAWTGDPPPDLLRGQIASAPRRPLSAGAPTLLLLLSLGIAGIVYPLIGLLAWRWSGSPVVFSTGPTGGEVGAAAAGAAAMLLIGRRRLGLGMRAARAALLFVVLITTARLIDYQIAVRTDGPSRLAPLFVETAERPHFRRHDVSFVPTIKVSGLMLRREEISVSNALVARLVPGDSCITARLSERRGYVFIAFERLASAGDGSGSYLVRDLARARCLGG